MDALIGYTGFVGNHLARQHNFEAQFNTKNITEIANYNYNIVVCAAAPGSMFDANKFPDSDRDKINTLIDTLSKVQTQKFILISSIAVFDAFDGQYKEDSRAFQKTLAYGRHRRELEVFCQEKFDNCLIVRLPALFGQGLKKNFLFDLLNPVPTMLTKTRLENLFNKLDIEFTDYLKAIYSFDTVTEMWKVNREQLNLFSNKTTLENVLIETGFSAIQFHNPKTTYQYYEIARLWSDICIAKNEELSLIHLATEPLNTSIIYKKLFQKDMPDNGTPIHNEDLQSNYALLWNCKGPYLYNSDHILDRIFNFYKEVKE